MVSSEDLAKAVIKRIIFHDIPKHSKSAASKPLLADALTNIDAKQSSMLKQRLVRTLNSKSAYEIEFDPDTSSPLPAEVEKYTSSKSNEKNFITLSKKLAQYLFDRQNGQMSAGLLCVMEVVTGGRNSIAVLKLEREQGVDLELSTKGPRRFEMSVLENLVFTDGTRLFKSALFINNGKNDFISAACDNQKSVMSSTDVARFWLKYLGCRVTEEPRVATQKWFDTTVQFINDAIADPVLKNDLYEHLLSEVKSNRKKILPKKFIEDYFPDEHRNDYENFLKEKGVSLNGFEKDVSDIHGKITKKSLHTIRGVTVTMPADKQDLVNITSEQIIVQDRLQGVSK